MTETVQFTNDPDGQRMFRMGGIAAFVLVAGYFLSFPIYFWVGDMPPSNVEAQLVYYSEHAAGWWAILGLMVFTDLLYVPIFFALYRALKEVNKNIMQLALAFMGLFVILDLAVTWTAFSALFIAGANYAAATTEAARLALIGAAGYPSSMIVSPLSGAYSILFPSLGILLTGLVMRKGVFNKTTAYLALAAGVTGIIYMGSYAVDALAVFRYINAFIAMIWFLFAGFRLYRLARQ